MEVIDWNGKPIKKPGVYRRIPLAKYHSQDICDGPSVSSTNLRRVLECNGGSPAHFWDEWSGNPNGAEPEEKDHHVLGRAAHHLILGEPNFRKHYIDRPLEFNDWRSAASRDWREAAEARGFTVVTQKDLEIIVGMARSIENTILRPDDDSEKEMVVRELLGGKIECSFIWFDKPSGLWIKSRPDAVPSDSGQFVDLKTCTSVQYRDMASAVTDWSYHQQAALVAEGARICAGISPADFSFVLLFCEKKRPYCVRAVEMKQDQIALGIMQNRHALWLIARGLREKRWPGPGGNRQIEHVDLHKYYQDNAEHELGVIENMIELERKAGPTRKRA